MSSNDQTPPITRPRATTPASSPPPPGVSRGLLIGMGVAIVVLSFVAAFLGSWLARTTDTAEAAPVPTDTVVAEPSPDPEETVSPDYQAIVEELLPAGSAVRAGTGKPESGKGYEGDVYIDRATADVWIFQDDWVWVGNIKTNAAENLTGETGATGATGAQGEAGTPGEAGAPGTAGTQVALGSAEPSNDTCITDGDIFVNVNVLEPPAQFYTCTDGAWVLENPPTQ